MSPVLLDTHAWIWSLMAPSRLGEAAEAAIAAADSVFVSPISVYEVTRKARLGGWPEIIPRLDELVAETETLTAPFTRNTAARAAQLDWRHRDPFDRFIAATAIELPCPLVSKDTEFDSLSGESGWPGARLVITLVTRSHCGPPPVDAGRGDNYLARGGKF